MFLLGRNTKIDGRGCDERGGVEARGDLKHQQALGLAWRFRTAYIVYHSSVLKDISVGGMDVWDVLVSGRTAACIIMLLQSPKHSPKPKIAVFLSVCSSSCKIPIQFQIKTAHDMLVLLYSIVQYSSLG